MIGARLGQDEFAVEQQNAIPDRIKILVVENIQSTSAEFKMVRSMYSK